jgi:hypothetical protein
VNTGTATCAICGGHFTVFHDEQRFGICPTHQNLLGQGFVAIVGFEDGETTGTFALIKRDIAAELGLEFDEDDHIAVGSQAVIDQLTALAAKKANVYH